MQRGEEKGDEEGGGKNQTPFDNVEKDKRGEEGSTMGRVELGLEKG